MNPWLSIALASSRGRELRGEAPGSRACEIPRAAATSRIGPPGAGAWVARGARRRSRVRHRVGFALVEAGLHLLATPGRSGG
jgi:hypothetical protein